MNLTQLFCHVDDFVKEKSSLLTKKLNNQQVSNHQSSYRNLKAVYLQYVIKYLHFQFQDLVSYNRFVELMRENIELLDLYLQSQLPARKISTGSMFKI